MTTTTEVLSSLLVPVRFHVGAAKYREPGNPKLCLMLGTTKSIDMKQVRSTYRLLRRNGVDVINARYQMVLLLNSICLPGAIVGEMNGEAR